MNIRQVSVIGVGAMGAPIGRRIRQAGFALTVYDVNASALRRSADGKVTVALSPADTAQADLVIVLVSSAAQVQDVLEGDNGVLAGIRRGGQSPAPVVAIMSTVGPRTVKMLAQRLAPHGIRIVDAPISGGVPRAENGTLSIFASGDDEVLDAIAPVFDVIGNRVFRCGSTGAGQTVKIVNNVIAAANVVVTAEAWRLAIENDIDIPGLAPMLDASSGRNFFSADATQAVAAFASWTRSREDFDGLLSILRKDIALASELHADALPAIGALQSMMSGLDQETFDTWQRIGNH